MTEADFEQYVEDNGLEYRPDYSGRAMYGKTCPAFTADSINDAFGFFVSMGREATQDDCEEMIQNARHDQMGTGIIVYFPSLKWEESA